MALINYLYHAIAAFILNLRASYYSNKVFQGEKGYGAKLKSVGAKSNAHEKARDEAGKEIRGWFK